MKQAIRQSNLEDVAEPLMLQEVMLSSVHSLEEEQPARQLPSYRPTPWKVTNRLLDGIDALTKGHADWVQRFCTYLFIGGFAALVNLAVFYLIVYHVGLPVNSMVHNIIASVLACEISIMANFVPNDYFTFKHLAGHDRSWSARCARFHITSLGGSLLTFLIQFGFSYIGHVLAIIAQAAALIIVLFYNFSAHHLFTYRRVKHAHS